MTWFYVEILFGLVIGFIFALIVAFVLVPKQDGGE